MGGKKKLSLKQIERMQTRQDKQEKEKKKKDKTAGFREKKPAAIVPPDIRDEKIIGELKKMRVLTPYAVATRFNMRISIAKDFLEQLEERGVVQMVSGNHSLKIYKPMD